MAISPYDDCHQYSDMRSKMEQQRCYAMEKQAMLQRIASGQYINPYLQMFYDAHNATPNYTPSHLATELLLLCN